MVVLLSRGGATPPATARRVYGRVWARETSGPSRQTKRLQEAREVKECRKRGSSALGDRGRDVGSAADKAASKRCIQLGCGRIVVPAGSSYDAPGGRAMPCLSAFARGVVGRPASGESVAGRPMPRRCVIGDGEAGALRHELPARREYHRMIRRADLPQGVHDIQRRSSLPARVRCDHERMAARQDVGTGGAGVRAAGAGAVRRPQTQDHRFRASRRLASYLWD
jgi:hypothetical protein